MARLNKNLLAVRRYQKRHPARVRANQKKQYLRQKKAKWETRYRWLRNNPRSKLLTYARSAAKNKKLVCTLTKEDIVIPKRCPVFGIPLFFTEGRRTDNTPSLDRLDNSKGYVPGNVAVVSWRANNRKGDLTLREIARLYNFYIGA